MTNQQAAGPNPASEVDPVTFSILSSAFVSLVDEMVGALRDACLSFVIYCGDVSGGLLNARGELVAQGTRDVAVHVGALQPSTKAVIEDFGEVEQGIEEGDVFAFNEPYRGGTHLPDMTFISPIFWKDELIAFTATKGHWSDVGGATPGSMNALAADIYAEGLVIPPLKVVSRGVMRHDVRNLIMANIRIPVNSTGDLIAHIEAARVGERRLHSLIEKYGLDTVVGSMEGTLDHSERELAAVILECEEGAWETEDFIDYDPQAPDEGPVKVSLKMTIQHDPPRVIYDMRGSGPPVQSGMNGTRGSTFGALVAGTKYIFPKPLMNAGWLRIIKAVFPETSVVNAVRPYAVCGEVSGAYEKTTACVQRVWAQVLPRRSFAGNFNLEYVVAGGIDDRPGRNNNYFVYYHWHTGGWGGKFGADGRDCGAAIFGLGILNQSTEVIERLWPVTFDRLAPVTDSMGAGRWRGGAGLESVLRVENAGGVRLSYIADRGEDGPGGPRGLFGGADGIPIRVLKNIGTDDEENLPIYFADEFVGQHGNFYHVSSGGGGYGDPLERDPEAVMEDVMDKYISMRSALEHYGVVMEVRDAELLDYRIDFEATQALRAERRAARSNGGETSHE
ncbi:MAG: hydantoinase B/oxoprolinase family protein [bacterium]|nr:hydantoinase B/oxoprolinase family protein [Acidimicrobiia bacterium]MCY4648992.1 hydantoinase B/oxoprolinase family protein [bacterium]